MGLKDFSVVEALNTALARMDFLEISNQTVSAPSGQVFSALVAHTDATFGAVTKGGSDLPSASLSANSIRLGRFTQVTESAGGIVLGYYSPEGVNE